MNLNLAIHNDVIRAKMDGFLSSTLQQLVPTTATVPIVPSDHCDLQVFLCFRNATPITGGLVFCAPGIHRKYTAGERTDLVSRAVTRGVSSSTSLIVAVAGFCRGGKSFNIVSVGGLPLLPPGCRNHSHRGPHWCDISLRLSTYRSIRHGYL